MIEILWIALCQRGNRVDPGNLEKIGIFLTDPLDPEQVRAVESFQNQFPASLPDTFLETRLMV